MLGTAAPTAGGGASCRAPPSTPWSCHPRPRVACPTQSLCGQQHLVLFCDGVTLGLTDTHSRNSSGVARSPSADARPACVLHANQADRPGGRRCRADTVLRVPATLTQSRPPTETVGRTPPVGQRPLGRRPPAHPLRFLPAHRHTTATIWARRSLRPRSAARSPISGGESGLYMM